MHETSRPARRNRATPRPPGAFAVIAALLALTTAAPLARAQQRGPDAGALDASTIATPPTSPPAAANAQPAANPNGPPALEGLSSAEFAALRPLAERGAAILVRDADQGPRARITVLLRARAPMATVHHVITTPEDYTTFMPTVSSVEVVSRYAGRTAFRFHVSAVMFDVTTLSNLHVVSPRRVDVAIVQSDIGPGGSRWDMMPDGDDATLVALTTWGDPSQGNWFLRQVAARSPNAIAGMNISADVILTFGAVRRAEILAGSHLPPRPTQRFAPPGPLAPPPPGPWMDLTRTVAIGAIALNDEGVITQSTMALYSPASPDVLRQRLADVAHYPSVWTSIHSVNVLSEQNNTRRYHMLVDSALSHTEGDMECTVDAGANGPVVWWRGLAGDYQNTEHRWDLWALPSGGTVVMLTGASEYESVGWMTRQMIDRDVWLVPGYATSWKLVWMRPLLVGL